ncbi:hypothetical protein GKQ77_27560, partial [Streptomyces sp. BG9H]
MRGDADGGPGRYGESGREGERGAGRGGSGEALWFQVLGPVRALRDGKPLKLGSPQQRATLAVLLLHDGRPVSTSELVDALWGEEPPPRAVGTLRTYVSRLRSLLEPDRRSREPARLLVSAGDGYALRVPRAALDACELEDRVAAARRMRAAGQHAEAHAELTAALALSDGTPLAGLPGPYAGRQRDRLTELSVTAQEELFACALELGCHGETTAPLRAFAAEHPLREPAQALLMLALHRAGRQADALAVYEATRRTLVAELGVDPGRELAALHEGLLKGTPPLPSVGPGAHLSDAHLSGIRSADVRSADARSADVRSADVRLSDARWPHARSSGNQAPDEQTSDSWTSGSWASASRSSASRSPGSPAPG